MHQTTVFIVIRYTPIVLGVILVNAILVIQDFGLTLLLNANRAIQSWLPVLSALIGPDVLYVQMDLVWILPITAFPAIQLSQTVQAAVLFQNASPALMAMHLLMDLVSSAV
jgi:hypothetical protein